MYGPIRLTEWVGLDLTFMTHVRLGQDMSMCFQSWVYPGIASSCLTQPMNTPNLY